jgi:hypothetical protein
VVLFGTASVVEDLDEKTKVLEALTEHLIPGRWQEIRQPSLDELKRTLVLSLPITEASAKVRNGPPKDDEPDYALDVWAGVIPLALTPSEPVADPLLPPEIATPEYASRYPGPGRFAADE